jgi:signal recognition particle receptor subunit beta
MAQWNRSERTLSTKIVYYGPSFGGKTTNLESLHRITDPQGRQQLTSVKTADDRTLFFDLLPIDLGEIMGYKIAVQVYTVPGQVRYETTRQVVLTGADAIVFVADSSTRREDQNRWAIQNLLMNMRSTQLDPAMVPVLFQANKQDLSDVATPLVVAQWLGLRKTEPMPAVATEGRNVLETFTGACHSMLEKLISRTDEKTRSSIGTGELAKQIDKAFAPILARQAAALKSGISELPQPPQESIVLGGEDLLADAVEASRCMGENFSGEAARARRAEKESEALRKLTESVMDVGSNFDRQANVDVAFKAAADTLNAPAVSLLYETNEGNIQPELCWKGLDDPLSGFEDGRRFLSMIFQRGKPIILDNLAEEFSDSRSEGAITGLRAVAAVPIEQSRTHSRMLLAYAAEPDGRFDQDDLKFLSILASQVGVGLEKATLYAEIEGCRDGMEQQVLEKLSQEIKTPLTAILHASASLRDLGETAGEQTELVATIANSAQALQGLIDNLFRLAQKSRGTTT